MPKWKQEAQDLLRQCRNEPIKILVWGPGDPGPKAPREKQKAYRKRLKIRKVLRSRFPFAEVYFSEDPEMKALRLTGMSDLDLEMLQATFADLIIMLDITRGVDLELDYFLPNFPWFRDKAYIFLPEQYVSTNGL